MTNPTATGSAEREPEQAPTPKLRGPQWAHEFLATKKPPLTAPQPKPGQPQLLPHSNGNGQGAPYYRAALQGEVAKVAGTPPGSHYRNTQLNESTLKLAHYVAGGGLDFDEVVAALRQASAANDVGASEIRKTLHSAMTAGLQEPKTAPPLPTHASEVSEEKIHEHTEAEADFDREAEGQSEDEPEVPSSWRPVDLTSVLDGTWQPPKPTVGRRQDGLGLFYPGKTHTVVSETEGGKTWLALAACIAEMDAGCHVVYVDFEDDRASSSWPPHHPRRQPRGDR